MKKRNLLYAAIILSMLVALSSCFHNHDVSIRVNEDEDEYRMRASFDEDLTADVHRVINRHLRNHHLGSYVHVYTDREIRFDDGTNFYIKTGPGRLRIKIDKTENPEQGCEELQAMCEEIKAVLANRNENE